MAVSKVKKVRIYGTKKKLKEILKTIKKEEFFHVERFSSLKKKVPESLLEEEGYLSREFENLEKVKFLLEQAKKLIGKEALAPVKISFSEAKKIRERFSLESIYSEYRKLQAELTSLNSQRSTLQSKLGLLKPWLSLNIRKETLEKIRRVKVVFGSCRSSDLTRLAGENLPIIEVSREGTETYVLWISRDEPPEFLKPVDVLSLLSEKDLKSTYEKILKEISELNEKAREISSRMQDLLKNSLDFLKLLHDELENLKLDAEVESRTWKTRRLFVLEGWIENRNLKKLSYILKEHHVSWEAESPSKEDTPPVKLVNPPQINHFEEITKLYSLPSYGETDPTPFLAPFFAIFFGVCLTDAAYGIILMVASLLLYRKMKNSLLIVLFWGGFFSLVFGALTGGWLSNLFPMLSKTYPSLEPVKKALESVKIMDPLNDILLFIGVAIAFGYIHLLVGILIGVANSIKNGDIMELLSERLSQLQFLLAIGFVALVNLIPSLSNLKALSLKVLLTSVAIFVVLAGLPTRNPITMIPSGLFAFYLDGVGILSDLLSYSRLMALGLATGVIGMAINIIANLVLPTPVVGALIFVLVLIIGHLFNLAMNALGGFIHTARLHFVEFFGKFYTGGGKPFVEYREIRHYSFIEKQLEKQLARR